MEEQPGPTMVVPVPMPRQNRGPKPLEELGDRLADEVVLESEKSESEASTKTSNSDSGIEDGKSTPTLEEEKVLFVLDLEILLYVLMKYYLVHSNTVINYKMCFQGCCGDSRDRTATISSPL